MSFFFFLEHILKFVSPKIKPIISLTLWRANRSFLSFSINLITSETNSLSLYSPFILFKFSCKFFEANISLYALSNL